MRHIGPTEVLKGAIQKATNGNELKAGEYIYGYEITERVVPVLNTLVKLVVNTSYLKPETQAVLIGNKSYRNCGTVEGAAENKNSSRSRVYYDICKLKRVLGNELIEGILKADDTTLNKINSELLSLIEKYDKNVLAKQFAIKTPQVSQGEYHELSENEWKELYCFMKYYSKKTMAKMEERISVKQITYLNYLECHEEELTELQKKQLGIARELLI